MKKITLEVSELWPVVDITWHLGAPMKPSSKSLQKKYCCALSFSLSKLCRVYDMTKHVEIGSLLQHEGLFYFGLHQRQIQVGALPPSSYSCN